MTSQYSSFQHCQEVYFYQLCRRAITFPVAPVGGPSQLNLAPGFLRYLFFEDAGVGLIYYGAFPNFMPNDSITATLSTQERFPAGLRR